MRCGRALSCGRSAFALRGLKHLEYTKLTWLDRGIEIIKMELGGARNGALDVLRLVAAIGIVWFHANAPGALFGYAGLSVFLFLATALPSITDRGASLSTVLRTRFHRLIRPWLIWSAIYGVLKIIEAFVENRNPLLDEFRAYHVLTGTSLHLWYLPYAALVGVATVIAGRWLRDLTTLRPIVMGLAFLSVPACLSVSSLTSGIPLSQWTFASGAVLLGFAFGLGIARKMSPGVLVGIAVLGGGVLAALLWVNGQATERLIASEFVILAGSAAAALALTRPVPGSPRTRYLGDLAMPVYLIHPLFLSVMARIGNTHAAVDAIAATVAAIMGGMVILSSSRLRALL